MGSRRSSSRPYWSTGVDQAQSAIDLSYSNRKSFLTKNSLKYQINPDWRLIGKLNYSESKSSLGEFYDGSYTEAVLGYGYRPVDTTGSTRS